MGTEDLFGLPGRGMQISELINASVQGNAQLDQGREIKLRLPFHVIADHIADQDLSLAK